MKIKTIITGCFSSLNTLFWEKFQHVQFIFPIKLIMFGSSSHGGWFGFATSNNDWIESKFKLGILFQHIVSDLGLKIYNL